ncbi:expressed unknown protein [Seminavis robusta]|uniref:Uncharacterized protein n=1 Tax=Seminavis robusta TaxID=568900 RepID=A0A9N8F0L2_9STRA|nr:expressed unknown protein [Seminavis robusta]|eukprot:Sro2378_g325380.1 n/a (199) ;mRNA; f:2397-3084
MVLHKINCRAQPEELESLKDDISSFSRGPLDRYDLDSMGFARLGLTRKRVALSILTFAVAGFVGILRWTFSPESIVTTVTPIPTSSDAVPEKLNLMMDKLERLGDQVERLVSSNLKEQTPDTAKNAQQTEVEKRLEKVVQGAKQWFDDTVSDKLQEINHTVVDMHQQLAQEARDIAEELDRKITTRLKSLEESIADRT